MDDADWFGTKSLDAALVRAFRDEARRVLAGPDRGFADVQTFCLFVGYPRSGHSLIGSLLDAHPEAVIAHELDALAFVEQGFSRDELFALLHENSRRFTDGGREWTGYQYEVAGQWHGRARVLRVLGDKKGGRTTQRLMREPALLARTRALVGRPVRLVHGVRNPYDNIASRVRNNRKLDIEAATAQHLAMVAENERLMREAGPDCLTLRHEDLVADPHATLRRLCAHFDLDAPPDWVDACAALVRPSTSRSRDGATWTASARGAVERGIATYAVLADYSFDG